MTDVCGEDPSFVCREVLNRTDDRGLAELADMLLGTTLTVIAIFLAAILVNRFATRSIKRGLRTLHSGAVRERLGALRRRAPAAL
jgi:moderate conductance mechanosensitive channel